MTRDRATPWHLWLVGLAALLFNAGGGYDYIMMQTGNAAYQAMLTPEMIAFYEGFPFWMEAAWGVSVWFAIGGAVLILLRRRIAAPTFLIAFIAYLVTGAYMYLVATPPPGVLTTGTHVFALLIGLQLVLLWLYSRNMARRGVLT